MPLLRSIVPWEISQVTPWDCRSFVSVAVNRKLELVGTVAVLGESVTAMPESTVMTDVSVFLVSAAEVAVMVTSRMQTSCALVQLFPAIFLGSGTDCGAVKMTVEFAEFAGMVPVSEVQAVAVPVCCFPLLSKVKV